MMKMKMPCFLRLCPPTEMAARILPVNTNFRGRLVGHNDEIHITFAHRGDIVYRNTTVEVKPWMNRWICLPWICTETSIGTRFFHQKVGGKQLLCQDDVENTYIAMDYIQDVFGDHELLTNCLKCR